MQSPFRARLFLMLLVGALLPGASNAGLRVPPARVLGTNKEVLNASIGLNVKRIGAGNTLRFHTQVISDDLLDSGHWEVVLPPGLTYLSGSLQGAAFARGWSGNNYSLGDALVLAERPGTFEIGLNVFASRDSSTWSRLEYNHVIRVTADSFETVKQIDWDTVREQVVMDGVHYGLFLVDAVPLDPGEDEQPVPFRLFDGLSKAAPVLEQHAATRRQATAALGPVEVPIRVAVDRTGRVKAAGISGFGDRKPTLDELAAIEAARKWRFTPAIQNGRPVTALYLIRVPVKVSEGQ